MRKINKITSFIRRARKPLRRTVAMILNIAMLLTMSSVNDLGVVFAAGSDSGITINGKTAVDDKFTFVYGEELVVKDKDGHTLEAGHNDYAYKAGDGERNSENITAVGAPEEPGDYLFIVVTGADTYYFNLTIEKDKFKVPTDLKWGDNYSYTISWTKPVENCSGLTLEDSKVKGYEVKVYKADSTGAFVQTGDTINVLGANTTSYDVKSIVDAAGYGKYKFSVQIKSEEPEHYLDSDVVETTAYWSKDTVKPEIITDSFKFEYNSAEIPQPVLSAKVQDNESGIHGYAFYKGADELAHDATTGWTIPQGDEASAGVEHTFTQTVTEPGSYKFYVKDKDNVSAVSDAIAIAKVTYNDYYNGGNNTKKDNFVKYVQTNSGGVLLVPIRKGYVFDGWYKEAGFTNKVESLATNSVEDITLYAKWTKSTISVNIIEGTESTGILTDAGMTYSGVGQIKADVTKPSTVDVTYQWYKYNDASASEDKYDAIDGATSSTLDVKDVADSGQYKVKVTWDESADDGSISATANVKINQKTLRITPKLVDGKTVYYADDKPDAAEYTFTIADEDLADADKADDKKATIIAEIKASSGVYNTNYEKGYDTGAYNITVSGFSASNYELSPQTGNFTVQPKAVSDELENGVSISLTPEEGKEADTYSFKGAGNHVEPVAVLIDSNLTESDGTTPKALVLGTDYTVAYSNNINVTDDALVTITFQGNYSGTLTKKFKIEKTGYASEVSLSSDVFDTDGTYMYDGIAHGPAFSVSNNPESGAVKYYFQAATLDAKGNITGYGTATEDVPVHAGKYQVYAVISATTNYTEVTTPTRAFEITKRPITIKSESGTWVYDGNQHAIKDIPDANITGAEGGTFAPGEDFKFKNATGEITNVGVVDNEIHYEFAEGTLDSDYDVTLQPGKLTITEQQLKTPANQKWEKVETRDKSKLALATWIAVTKDHVDIEYELQLYRIDDGAYTKVGDPVEHVTGTSYSFYETMIADSKENGVPDSYFFTVKTVPAGGEKKDNYSISNETVITGEGGSGISSALDQINTTKLTIGYDAVTMSNAVFRIDENDSIDPLYAVQGQIISAKATARPGYTLNGVNISGDGLFYSYNSISGDCTFHVLTNSTLAKAITVTAHGSDDHPHLIRFEAEAEKNSDNAKQKVVISFKATDLLGLTHIRIDKNPGGWTSENIGTSKANALALTEYEVSDEMHSETVNGVKYDFTYNLVDGKYTVEGTATVTDSGEYNFVVWDTSNHNWTYWAKTVKVTETRDDKPVVVEKSVLNPIMVYKLSFAPGKAGGNDATMSSTYPSYILKLSDEKINIPDITGKIFANGYTFTNFRGSTGLYPNNGVYTANKDDTLTALWNDENYRYTVEYYYQDIDASTGKAEVDESKNPVYTQDTEATATFIAHYGEGINPGLDKIQKSKTGFVRATDNDTESTFTVDTSVITDGKINKVVKVYYKRAPYTITYKYVDTDGETKPYTYTDASGNEFNGTESYNFGEAVTEMTSKPSKDGYTFIGWTYGDSGKTPETMPEKNITATGKFEPNTTKYVIDYYYQNINDDNYTLDHSEDKYTYTDGTKTGEGADAELVYFSAKHGQEIDLTKMTAPVIEGFTLNKTGATNGASSENCPTENVTSGTVSALSGQTLHIAYYYTRNKYTITLNVYKGGRGETPIFTKTEADIKYQTPFDATHRTYYETLGGGDTAWKSKIPEADKDVYELYEIADWSTGEVPASMPAGNITISRDYISTTLCPYDVEIYYEKTVGNYEKYDTVLTQYASEHAVIEVAKTGDDTPAHILLTESDLHSIFADLAYYELDTTTEKLAVGKGTVVDPLKNDGKRLTVKAYFKRPIYNTVITYKYYDPTLDETITIGTLTKSGKWDTPYDAEVGLFFGEGGASKKATEKTETDGDEKWIFTPAKIRTTTNSSGKHDSGVGLTGSNLIDIKIDENGNIKLDGTGTLITESDFSNDAFKIENITYSARYLNTSGDFSYPQGSVSPAESGTSVDIKFGAEREKNSAKNLSEIKNYCTVTYIHSTGTGGVGHYYINLGYRTNELNRYKQDIGNGSHKEHVPLTVEITNAGEGYNGTYKVRVANKSDIFDGDTLRSGFKAYQYTNPKTNNTSVEVYLAPGNSTAAGPRIGDLSEDNFKDNYLYIVNDKNPYVWGAMLGGSGSSNNINWNTYRGIFDDNAVEELENYKSKEEELMNQHKTDSSVAYDESYYNARIWSYTPSYVAVLTGPIWQDIYYGYDPDIYLRYNLYGDTKQFNVARNKDIKLSEYEDEVNSYFTPQEGKVIRWYQDSTFTTPAADFNIGTSTHVLYGRYEKAVYTGHHYVYYQLANKYKIGETEYDYLNEDQLKTLISANTTGFEVEECGDETIEYDTEFTGTDNTPIKAEFTSKKLIYKYNNEPVLISRTIPELSCTEVLSLNYKDSAYSSYVGFEYDSTETNKVRAYCEYEAIDLYAHYKRVTYPLTFDFNDKDATDHKKTDDVFIDAPFEANLSAIAPKAVRNGYKLKSPAWVYYKKEGTGDSATLTKIDPQPTVMPNYEVVAEAQWENDYFDYDVLHYFQKNDQTYETDLVKELAEKTTGGEKYNFIFGKDEANKGTATVYTASNGKKYAVFVTSAGETLFFSGVADATDAENKKFTATISDLIGMKTKVTKESEKLLSNSKYACDNFAYSKDATLGALVSNLAVYKYAFTVYRLGAEISTLHTTDNPNTYKADVDMELGLYYERDNNIVINIATRVTDDPYLTSDTTHENTKETGITALGNGKYNYGSQAKLTAQVAAGYEFVGWYETSEYNANVPYQDFETKATKYSSSQTITIQTTESLTLVAVTKPKKVNRPKNSIDNGMTGLKFGYADSSNNILTMNVDLGEDEEGNVISDSSTYHVKSYQWYKSDSEGAKGEPISGATAATYNFPTGENAGNYYYYCEVVVERLDNGRSITISANNKANPVVVDRADMIIAANGEDVIYDGLPHDGYITIDGSEIGSPANKKIYFSTEVLTSENLSTAKEYNYDVHHGNTYYPIDARESGVSFTDVLTKVVEGVTQVAIGSDGKFTPQYIYYYVKDDSEANGRPVNFNDASGSIPIIIRPKEVTIKPTAEAFKKIYDGTTNLTEKDVARFRNPGDYFDVVGLLGNDEGKLTAKFTGEYDHAHVDDATKIDVNISGIESVTGSVANYNYVVASTSTTVSFSGQVVARPVNIEWIYSNSEPDKAKVDGYFVYIFNGSEQAPTPVITDVCDDAEADKNESGVLSADKGKVSVEASGKQRNCSTYTAQGQLQIEGSESKLSDYKIDEEHLKCPFKIVSSELQMKLVDKTVDYDGQEHLLTKLTPEDLWTLGVISNKADAETDVTYTESNGVYTVEGNTTHVKASYQVNKKYKLAGTYKDLQVVPGTVKVMSADGKNITGNFTFAYPTSTLTINKKKVTVEGIAANDKEYDANTNATLVFTGVTFPQIVEGDTLSLDTSEVTGTFVDKNVGTDKTVNISIGDDALTGASANNYELITDTTVDVVDTDGKVANKHTQAITTASITPATLKVSPTGFNTITNYIYGETIPTAFSNTNAKDSNNIRVENSASSGYKGGEDRNTAVDEADDSKVTFIVKKSNGDTVSLSDLQYVGAGTYTVTLDTETVNGVSNVIKGMKSVNGNYIFVLGDTDTFTVNKRPVAITSSVTKTKVYDGTTAAIGKVSTAFADGDFTLRGVEGKSESGVVNSDAVSVTISGGNFAANYTDKNVGDTTKTIAVSGLTLTGAKANNYYIVNADGSANTTGSYSLTGCSITRAPLTITAEDITDVPYGTNPLTATVGSYKGSVAYSGFVSGENASNAGLTGTLVYTSRSGRPSDGVNTFKQFEASVPANRGVNVSNEYYDITPSGLTASNYEITYVSGKFNVVPKEVTITAKDFNLGYKDFNLTKLKDGYVAEASGWVYSDADTMKSTAEAYAKGAMYTEVEAALDKEAGVYDLVFGRTDKTKEALISELEALSSNYKFTLVPGKFTIGRRQLIIDEGSFNINSRIYDATKNVRGEQIVLTSAQIADMFTAKIEQDKSAEALPDVDKTKLADEYTSKGSKLSETLAALGLTIEGVYSDKDVAENKAVTLTFKLDKEKYLGQRYFFDIVDGKEVYEKTITTKTANITPKELHIKAKNITQVYGSALPAVDVNEVEVNPKSSPVDTDHDWKFAGTESFSVLGGTLAIDSTYKPSNTATKAGEAATRTPKGYESSNYDIHYDNGIVTVVQAQLATPENVLWSSENPGTLTWSKVSGIGDVEVGGYKIILVKKPSEGVSSIIETTGSTQQTVTVSVKKEDNTFEDVTYENAWVLDVNGQDADTWSHNFKPDVVHETDPIAIYTVLIWAYPASANNAAASDATDLAGNPVATNVKESPVADTSMIVTPGGKLAVAKVKPKFANDADTVKGKNNVSIEKVGGDGREKHEDGSITLIAGETAIITVELKEKNGNGTTAWTGYTVSDSNFTDATETVLAKWSDDWGVVAAADQGQKFDDTNKGKFTTTFTLKVGGNRTNLEPTVSLTPRLATISGSIETKDYTATETPLHIGYGFTQAVGPYAQVSVQPAFGDNVLSSDYEYTYDWTYSQGLGTGKIPPAEAISGNKAILPAKISGKDSPTGTYQYKCVITAKRKDNDKTTTMTLNSEKMYIDRTRASLAVSIDSWVYGAARVAPNVTTLHPENVPPVYQYNNVDDQDDSNWTETVPVNVGSYYVRASFAQSANYEAVYTPVMPFTISKAKYATPTAADWGATSTAPYGKASWTASPNIVENNGGAGSAATVKPVYEVKLYKKNGGSATVVDTRLVTGTSYDFGTIIDAKGEGTYYYTVQAKPSSKDNASVVAGTSENNRKNVDDSDMTVASTSNEVIIAKLTSSANVWTKTYDGTYSGAYVSGTTTQGITVLAKDNENSYEWYVNGTKETTLIGATVPVFNYKATSDKYSCISTATDGIKTYYITQTVTINKRNVTFTADSNTKVYDGTALVKDSYTSEGLADGDSVDANTITVQKTSGTETEERINVGTSDNVPSAFTIKRTVGGATENMSGNYNISYQRGTLTITPRPITTQSGGNNVFTIADIPSRMYNATEYKPEPTVTDTEYNVTLVKGTDFEYSYSNNIIAGVDTAVLTVTGKGNYSGTLTKNYTITKRPVEFVGGSDTKTYNKTEQSVTGFTTRKPEAAADGGLVNDGTNVHTASAEYKAARTEVGTTTGAFNTSKFKITASDNSDVTANYEISSTPGTMTITATDVPMLVSLANESFMYDATAKSLTGTPVVKGIGDAVPEGTTKVEYKFSDESTWTTDLSSLTKVSAGTYTINVRATNPNYASPAETTATLTIKKRPVTFVGKSEAKAFTNSEITINTLEHKATVSGAAGDLLSGDSANLTFEAKGTNVGTYVGVVKAGATTILSTDGTLAHVDDANIIIKDSNNDNVTANYDITITNGKLTINKSILDWIVYIADSVFTYDGTAKHNENTATSHMGNNTDGTAPSGTTEFQYEFVIGGVLGGWTSDLTTLTKTDAGTYTIRVRGINSNLNNEPTYDATLTINKADATVSVNYSTPGALSEGARNYNASPVTEGDFDITYSADSVENATGKGTRVVEWYRIVDGEETKLTSAPVSVGNYKIKVKYTEGDNFKATNVAEKEFSITKRPVTITSENHTWEYDKNTHKSEGVAALSVTTGSLATGESITGVTFTGSIQTVGTASNIFEAVVIKNGANDVTSNYEITSAYGTLTVTARNTSAMTVTLEGAEYVYDAGAHAITSAPVVKGLGDVSPEGTTTIRYQFAGDSEWTTDLSSLTKVSAGTYTINVKATNPNYGSPAETSAELKINKRNVKFVADNGSKVYDGDALVKDSYTVVGTGNEGLAAGDVVNTHVITVMKSDADTAEDRVDIGSSRNVPSAFTIKRTIGGTTTDVTDNYNISYQAGTLTVTKRPLNDSSQANGYKSYITVEDISDITYDGTAHQPEVTVKDSGRMDGGSQNTKILILGTDYTVTYHSNVNVTPNETTAYVEIKGIGNYSGTIKKYFKIVKRPITITSEDKSWEYDKKTHKSSGVTALSVTTGSLATGETITGVSFTGSIQTAGTASNTFANVVIKKGTKDVTANYAITPAYGTLTVTPRSTSGMTVTLAGAEYVYDATEHILTSNAVVKGIGNVAPEGTTIIRYQFAGDATWTEDLSSLTKIGVGTYTINVEATNPNYASPATTTAELKIKKRPVTFVGKSEAKEYTGQPITISEISVVTPSGTPVGGLVSGHVHNFTFTASGTEVNTYIGTVTEQSAVRIYSDSTHSVDVTDNYDITVKNGSLTIVKSAMDWFISLLQSNFTYDANDHYNTNTPEAHQGTDASGQTPAGTTTFLFRFKGIGNYVSDLTSLIKRNVGEYIIQIKATNPNLTDEKTAESKLVITRADATVAVDYNTALGGTINASGNREYRYDDAINSPVSVSENDFVITYSADSITNATGKGAKVVEWYSVVSGVETKLDVAPVNVGTYKIKVKYTQGDNFNATNVAEKTFNITKKTTVDSYYKVTTDDYTGLHDGQSHTGVVTYMPAGGTIKFGTTAEQAAGTDAANPALTTLPRYTDIGTYTIYYYVTDPNYANPLTGTIEVTIKPNIYAITYVSNLEVSNEVVSNMPEAGSKTQLIDTIISTVIPEAKDSDGITRYVFDGWNTKADGTGTTYASGATYAIDANIVLYAVWNERVEGTVIFDYNYVDPEDLGSKCTDQTLSETYVVLYQTIDGITKEIARDKITLNPKDDISGKSENNPYSFGEQPTYIDGHKVTYTVGLAAVPGNDISNYDINEHGYKNRDIVALYSPGSFKLKWVVTLDDKGFTADQIAKIPTSIDVKVLYRESADGSTDSFRVITQHATDSVHCLYDATTKTYHGEYLVWKWNSVTHDTYYHSLQIVGMTINDEQVVPGEQETWLLNYVYTQDPSVRPVCFEPDDRNVPLGEGKAVGGVNNDGVMTAKLYKYIPPTPEPDPDDDDIKPVPILPTVPVIPEIPVKIENPDTVVPTENTEDKPTTDPGTGKNRIVEILPSQKNIDEYIMTGFVEMTEEEVVAFLTGEEAKAHEAGDKATLRLEVKDVIKKTFDKAQEAVTMVMQPDENLAKIFDVSMFIKVGNLDERKLDPAHDKHKVSVQIPDEFIDHSGNVERQYRLYRIIIDEQGNYQTEYIDSELIGNNYLSFMADTVSSYALTYTGEPIKQKNFILFNFIAMLLMIILTLIMFLGKSKKEKDDEIKERRKVDEEYDDLWTKEEKQRKKNIRRRKTCNLIIAIISLIIYIIFFTWGKVVWFNRLSWYFAVALVLTLVSTIDRRFKKDIEEEEEKLQ